MNDTQPYIKWLLPGGRPAHGGKGRWPLPTQHADGSWTPGASLTVTGDIVPCQNGLHLCRLKDAAVWITAAAIPYLAQYRGELVPADDKVVAREARLIRRLLWNDRVARLFAADCAERALARSKVTDPRSHAAVKAARLYARGKIDAAAVAAARAAAWAAARDAARDAAWAAARAAAWAAARDAARAAAGTAERDWHGERLWFYFTGNEDDA